jgi:FkbM family methyltransferase
MAFDGDAFFAFQVHIVQHLVHHFAFADGIGNLQETVCQRGFTVIYVCNDAEIPDILHVSNCFLSLTLPAEALAKAGAKVKDLAGLKRSWSGFNNARTAFYGPDPHCLWLNRIKILLHALINWYTQRFPFPFRGWKYARRLLRATGQDRRLFLKKIHNGLLVQVSPQEHIQQQLFWYGFYEKKYVLAWERLLTPDAVVLDIGANIGYYSLVAAKKAAKGKIFAFEPQSATFQRLQFNINLNHLTNITLLPCGASDSSGEAVLFLSGNGNDGMSSLAKGTGFSPDTETISLVRLDDWASEQQLHIDFIKMDIEGAELKALYGLTRILQTDRPFLFLEISSELLSRFHHTPADVYILLQSLNYTAWTVNNHSSFSQTLIPAEDELVIFVPKEKEIECWGNSIPPRMAGESLKSF